MGFSVAALIVGGLAAGASVYQAQLQRRAARKQRREAASRVLEIRNTGSGHPIPIAYGLCAVEGIEVFANTADKYQTGPTGASQGTLPTKNKGKHNEYLLAQHVLSAGDFDGLINVLVDDKPISGSSISEYSRVQVEVGGTANAMATAFHAERTATDKFTGLTFLTGVFRLKPKDPQFSDRPRTLVVFRGRKLLRILNSNRVSAGRRYSNNSALVLFDYLTNSTYGPGTSADDWDLPALKAAADRCAVMVQGASPDIATDTYPPAVNMIEGTGYATYAEAYAVTGLTGVGGLGDDTVKGTDLSGVELSRYEFNGAIHSTSDFHAAIETIKETMPGAQFFRSLEGKFKLVVPNARRTAAQQSVGTIDDSVLVEAVEWRYVDAENRTNAFTASFLNANREFANDDITFPREGSAAWMSLQAADDGVVIREEAGIEGANNLYHATSIAANYVLMSRRRQITCRCKPIALAYEPGDIVQVSSVESGLIVHMMVYSREVTPDWEVVLDGLEFVPDDYSWIPTDLEPLNLAAIDPDAVNAPEELAIAFDTESELITSTITPPDEAVIQIVGYEVQARYAPQVEANPTYGDWVTVGVADDEVPILDWLPPIGLHSVEVRAASLGQFGERSDWTDAPDAINVHAFFGNGIVALSPTAVAMRVTPPAGTAITYAWQYKLGIREDNEWKDFAATDNAVNVVRVEPPFRGNAPVQGRVKPTVDGAAQAWIYLGMVETFPFPDAPPTVEDLVFSISATGYPSVSFSPIAAPPRPIHRYVVFVLNENDIEVMPLGTFGRGNPDLTTERTGAVPILLPGIYHAVVRAISLAADDDPASGLDDLAGDWIESNSVRWAGLDLVGEIDRLPSPPNIVPEISTLRVMIDAVLGADCYEWQYRLVDSSAWITSATTSAPEHTITGLLANARYEVRVMPIVKITDPTGGNPLHHLILGPLVEGGLTTIQYEWSGARDDPGLSGDEKMQHVGLFPDYELVRNAAGTNPAHQHDIIRPYPAIIDFTPTDYTAAIGFGTHRTLRAAYKGIATRQALFETYPTAIALDSEQTLNANRAFSDYDMLAFVNAYSSDSHTGVLADYVIQRDWLENTSGSGDSTKDSWLFRGAGTSPQIRRTSDTTFLVSAVGQNRPAIHAIHGYNFADFDVLYTGLGGSGSGTTGTLDDGAQFVGYDLYLISIEVMSGRGCYPVPNSIVAGRNTSVIRWEIASSGPTFRVASDTTFEFSDGLSKISIYGVNFAAGQTGGLRDDLVLPDTPRGALVGTWITAGTVTTPAADGTPGTVDSLALAIPAGGVPTVTFNKPTGFTGMVVRYDVRLFRDGLPLPDASLRVTTGIMDAMSVVLPTQSIAGSYHAEVRATATGALTGEWAASAAVEFAG